MFTIKEVKTKKQIKEFVEFPIKLYKGCPYFVPPLYSDEMAMFKKSYHYYDQAESVFFNAYDQNNIMVGRIQGILQNASNMKWNQKRVRFTRFDSIDNQEVANLLFEAVEKWAKDKGMEEIVGPLGFSDLEREGLLIEGFDEKTLFFTYYNAPYYKEHMKEIGLAKQVDWYEYRITIPQTIDQRIDRIANRILDKGYKIVKVKNHKELDPYIQKAFKMYNEAFAPLYGTVPLSEELVDYYMGSFLPLLDLDFISIIEDKEGEVIGFAAVVPSLGKATTKCKGKLFPFGWYHLLKALKKNDTIDMLLIAVKPELQGRGINAILMREIQKTCIKHGIKYAETGPELEVNTLVRGQWEAYEHVLARKRRLFIAKLSELKVD